ncbi:MAG: ribbon-helix-helix protein, CopG family [Nitrospirota bacterium]
MRTSIELPDNALKALEEICRRQKISRAEAIRRAIAAYSRRAHPQTNEAFGIWRSRRPDGLEYHETLRAEWVVQEGSHHQRD